MQVLTERQKFVIETLRMRLSSQQALDYMRDNGFTISRATYARDKAKLEELKLSRLWHIGRMGFIDQHIDRIDNLELTLRLMWQNYRDERSPFKKVIILEKIAALQPYLSSYYESTKDVIEESPDIQEQLTALENRLNEDEILNNSFVRQKISNQTAETILGLNQEQIDKEAKDLQSTNTPHDDSNTGNNNKDAIQPIDEQSKEGSDNNLPQHRGEQEENREKGLDEGETQYRKQKDSAIFDY